MEARFKAHVDTSNRVKDTIESWGLRLMPVSREVEVRLWGEGWRHGLCVPCKRKRGLERASGKERCTP